MPQPHGLFAGLATLDVAQHVERPPGANEKVTATATHLSAGGPAANAAVAFAALGGRATLLTALGESPTAVLVRAELEEQGVDVVDVTPDATAPPPVSAIIVTTATGERSVVGSDAVASTVEAPDGEALAALVADADVVLVDGHHPRLGVGTATAARTAGVPVVLDLGRWKPAMDALVPLADHVVCSADARAPGATDHASSVAALRERGARVVVVTRGAAPALWWADGDDGEVAVPRVVAVDTLGAGDAFHGAYTFAVGCGQGPTAAVRLGVDVASLRVAHAGPRAWAAHLPARQGATDD
ncbi:PfkB family carbohydrate kinase [Serinibacter arcticus]|nr:PfkB family carbohydrate kinase [Serinibacter arcticus]